MWRSEHPRVVPLGAQQAARRACAVAAVASIWIKIARSLVVRVRALSQQQMGPGISIVSGVGRNHSLKLGHPPRPTRPSPPLERELTSVFFSDSHILSPECCFSPKVHLVCPSARTPFSNGGQCCSLRCAFCGRRADGLGAVRIHICAQKCWVRSEVITPGCNLA